MDEQSGGKWLSTISNTEMIVSCKAWNSPVEYLNKEYKFRIKESDENVFKTIVTKRSCGRNIPKGEQMQTKIIWFQKAQFRDS